MGSYEPLLEAEGGPGRWARAQGHTARLLPGPESEANAARGECGFGV